MTHMDTHDHCSVKCSNLHCVICVCELIQIGQFFGEVDPVLMISLVNTSLYSFNKTYDYQSVCDPEKDSKAAAGPRSIYVVRYSLTYINTSRCVFFCNRNSKNISLSAIFCNRLFITFFSCPSPAYHCRLAQYWLVGL